MCKKNSTFARRSAKGKTMTKKILLGVAGTIVGLLLLLLVAVGCVLYVPAVQQAVIDKGLTMAREQTGMDIEMSDLSLVIGDTLSPSPLALRLSSFALYRAYKGQSDLPLGIAIDSLFVGHRGQDTLICVQRLRLQADIRRFKDSKIQDSENLLALPIEVEQLYLDGVTFHSDSMIAAVGIDALVGLLDVSSPAINIAKGQYPLHGLRLENADVMIALRDTPPDTTVQDTTPLLMAFEVPDGELHNVRFRLQPLGLDLRTGSLSTDVTADVGQNLYDARRLEIGRLTFGLGDLRIPADTIYGNARVDLAKQSIRSEGLHVRSKELGARADLYSTTMNLETMRVDVRGDAAFQGSQARLRGFYDIDDAAYDMTVEVEKVDLSALLQDHTPMVIAGELHAQGNGIDPHSRAMKSKVHLHLKDGIYDKYNVSGLRLDAELADHTLDGSLHLPLTMNTPDLRVQAQTEHRFHVAGLLSESKDRLVTPDRMRVNYRAQLNRVRAHVAGEDVRMDHMDLRFATADSTHLNVATKGLQIDVASPMHVMQLVEEISLITQYSSLITQNLSPFSLLDSLHRLIPDIQTSIVLEHGSPAQPFLARAGIDIDKIALSVRSDSLLTDLSLDASIPEISHPEDSTALRLPPAHAALRMGLQEGRTTASLTADSRLTDGAMSLYGLCSDAAFRLDLTREEDRLNGEGRLTLDSLTYNNMNLGNRTIDLRISPSEAYDQAFRAEVRAEEIPLDIIDGFVSLPDIALRGAVRARAMVDGLPHTTDISADVLPLAVSAEYKPYQVGISLGETPIVMEHNHIDLNGLPVYGADSTFIALTGGLDLDSMRMDITLAADSFAPVKLTKGGPIPVYGELATDLHGTVTGPLDSIVADVAVTILPTTDITYPISKKNLAQVRPHGTVNVRYGTADGALDLGGRINVDDGYIRYSPKAYPIMPFHVDSGSHILFQGPVGRTKLDVSASQKVKADVQSTGEDTRRVDFRTGVRVNGEVDSIGLQSIGFFLEAPNDEAITRELESVDEGTREGLAATLLATGMYVGESNEAAQREGYALSSIINSRINAALANSKVGKFMEVDISSGQSTHAAGKTNDMNIAISKSFFKNKLRITIGSTITDNPDINQTQGLLSSLTADYKLTKDGDVLLRLFSQRDDNNILEGDLYKYGLGVRAQKEWKKKYDLTADAGVAYRSNNSIGPDLTLKSSIKNLFGRGETFTIKGNGAYYWALRNRHPGDPKKTDTYKLGVNASFIFPYLHWTGDNNPAGDTRYMLGYQYENIAGGYGVHKMSGSFTYFIRSTPFITHAFTPFSLSVVRMNAESEDLLNKAEEYPQLIKIIAGDEFVPSIGYNFIYNDYRAKRAVNTMLDLGVKEAGNLINAFYCAFGYKWSDGDKPLGKITFNQFVKLSVELRNRFNLTDQVCIATRLCAGANIPLGNSTFAPLSEAFYAGGPNNMRSASPYAYGPGNFYSAKYNQNFFHAGDVKLEANLELRFPIVWKLYGATFVDAGNVWNWYSTVDLFKAAGYEDYLTRLEIPSNLYDGLYNNPEFARQIALGTGAGLRLDLDGLVVRLDIGVAIHAPYQTFKYDKKTWQPDTTQPINTYFNIPSAVDAIRINFGIGYPF